MSESLSVYSFESQVSTIGTKLVCCSYFKKGNQPQNENMKCGNSLFSLLINEQRTVFLFRLC